MAEYIVGLSNHLSVLIFIFFMITIADIHYGSCVLSAIKLKTELYYVIS